MMPVVPPAATGIGEESGFLPSPARSHALRSRSRPSWPPRQNHTSIEGRSIEAPSSLVMRAAPPADDTLKNMTLFVLLALPSFAMSVCVVIGPAAPAPPAPSLPAALHSNAAMPSLRPTAKRSVSERTSLCSAYGEPTGLPLRKKESERAPASSWSATRSPALKGAMAFLSVFAEPPSTRQVPSFTQQKPSLLYPGPCSTLRGLAVMMPTRAPSDRDASFSVNSALYTPLSGGIGGPNEHSPSRSKRTWCGEGCVSVRPEDGGEQRVCEQRPSRAPCGHRWTSSRSCS